MREEWEDDEVEGKYYHAFNSKSASIGETLIAMKIAECEEAGMSFEEVVDTVETYIETQHTYFLLESLDMLEKAGRLGHLAAKLINTLNGPGPGHEGRHRQDGRIHARERRVSGRAYLNDFPLCGAGPGRIPEGESS